jgi:hypothetical protein
MPDSEELSSSRFDPAPGSDQTRLEHAPDSPLPDIEEPIVGQADRDYLAQPSTTEAEEFSTRLEGNYLAQTLDEAPEESVSVEPSAAEAFTTAVQAEVVERTAREGSEIAPVEPDSIDSIAPNFEDAPEQSSEDGNVDPRVQIRRLDAKYEEVQNGDYFSILGLPRSAGTQEVHRAFGTLSAEFNPLRFALHPDPSLQRRAQLIHDALVEAASVLQDERLRTQYAGNLLD